MIDNLFFNESNHQYQSIGAACIIVGRQGALDR